MRIRSIKPEFWRSDDITALSIEDRLLFIGLWSYVDDNGVGIDKLYAICADLFAGDIERDPRETFARVSRGLQNLSEAGLITRYTVDDKPYLAITNWSKHQRIDKPNKPRFPQPDAENAIPRETVATPSRDIRETPAPGTGEQGNRGTGERTTSSTGSAAGPATPDTFPQFWSVYPRKEAKRKAMSAYRQALKRADAETIIAGARRYRDDPNREQAFTALPTTWLNGDRWDDDPLPQRLDKHSRPPAPPSISDRLPIVGGGL